MNQIIFIFSVFVCGSFAVKIEFDTENGIENARILENIFRNNKDDINEYLDLSEYRANGSYVPEEYEAENVTQLELEAFGGSPGRINSHGYPVEEHYVQTSDGYILKMHRIPSSPKSTKVDVRRPVFLMHGLLDSADCWVLMGPNSSLAYLLADLGYDVWMGNARGNRYSRSHTRWNPDGDRRNRREFWNFSWNEIGLIDVPAMIDYVLANNTNFKQVHYIGHSQGTTAFFVMAAERPEYNAKILMMNALAPVSFMTNCKSPAGRAVARLLDNSQAIIRVLGQYEFLPGNDILSSSAAAFCRTNSLFAYMCKNILFLFGGFNSALFDESKFPLILKHTPAGSSAAQIILYGQLMKTTRFRKFDYGMLTNLRKYGSIRPPNYRLDRITAPVALHYGRNDLFADVLDVQRLSAQLPNLFGLFPAPHPRFNHFDFLWAINVRELLYNRIAVLMKTAERNAP